MLYQPSTCDNNISSASRWDGSLAGNGEEIEGEPGQNGDMVRVGLASQQGCHIWISLWQEVKFRFQHWCETGTEPGRGRATAGRSLELPFRADAALSGSLG